MFQHELARLTNRTRTKVLLQGAIARGDDLIWQHLRQCVYKPRLTATTGPNLVYNPRAKLDGAGHYDDSGLWEALRERAAPGER